MQNKYKVESRNTLNLRLEYKTQAMESHKRIYPSYL